MSQAPLNNLLTNPKNNDKREVPRNSGGDAAFEQIKCELSEATCLVHSKFDAQLCLVTDATNFAIGAVLEQKSNDLWESLAFFSKKFSPAQTKYSAYDRELKTIYEDNILEPWLKGVSFTCSEITNLLLRPF